ncbi:MAG: L-histidine N(alpha)-methyltransferase [Pseudomonadota bacterium]
MDNTATISEPQDDRSSDDIAELIAGLSQPQKMISPKYFYDEHGSELFEQITRQPEYYPTRTELSILRLYIDEISEALGDGVSLIEFGAGASVKVRILLDHVEGIQVFVPVDISGDHLALAAKELADDYPNIEVLPVAADFTRPFDLPSPKIMPERNVVFFPGSTIGNFAPDDALALLDTMRTVTKSGGALLIGVDLKKDAGVLERAYNDTAGTTAAFNLNMLTHLNRDYGANFDKSKFMHRSLYNERHGRIEMHLVSTEPQSVDLGDKTFDFKVGEYILTECSYKYTVEEFAELAGKAGFKVERVWTDVAPNFSLQYLTVVDH